MLYGLLEVLIATVNFSAIVGVIGFIVHFSNVVIPFILVKIITSRSKLLTAIEWVLWMAIPLCILGIMQYNLPPDNYLNKYAIEISEDTDVTSIAVVGDSVRITSVFSFISPYGTFLNFALLLIFFLISTSKSKNKILLYSGVYFLLIINALMSGSRSLVGIALLETLALIFLFNNFSVKKIIAKFSRILIIGTVSIIVLIQLKIGSKALDNFVGRVESNNDIEGRILDTTDPFKFASIAGPFGYGIGATYQGGFSFSKSQVVIPVYFEEEPERMLLELGVIGMIFSYIIKFYILYFVFDIYRTQKDPFWKKLSSIPLIYMVVATLGFFSIIFNWMEGIVYWSMIGLSACIKYISNNEQTAQSISNTPTNPVQS